MVFRSRGAERKFDVELTVHRLNAIPVTHRMLSIHWRMARRNAGSPHWGFTAARPVEPGNFVEWGAVFPFVAKIGHDPAHEDALTLQSTILQLQLRSERRSRIGLPSHNQEGVVEIDLADVAPVGVLDRNILLQESPLNATLHVTVKMIQISGDKVFRTRSPLQNNADPAASVDGLPVVGTVPLISQARGLQRNASSSRLAKLDSFKSSASSATFADRSRVSGGLHLPNVSGNVAEPMKSMQESEAFYAPDPNEVQAEVYQQLFWERLRDEWPLDVESSRCDPVDCVEKMFREILRDCKIQSPKHDPRQSPLSGAQDETQMTVEGLLASLYHPAARKPSSRWRVGEAIEDGAKENGENKGIS